MVMVNWNQRANTLESIRSLLKLDYSRLSLVVVDNGSEDGSVDAIKREFPGITILENATNLGAPIALNQGMKHALQHGADYICLMDNDILADEQMLKELITVAESDPRIAATGPKMYYYDSPKTIWCAGAKIVWKSAETFRLQAEQIDGDNEKPEPQDVDMIPSCALCIKRAALEAVGLMDPRYFVYYNDSDWCARAISQGGRIVYVPSAKLWHKVSATTKAASPTVDYYMTRNRFLFLVRNLSGIRRYQALLYTGMRNLLAIAAYTVKSHNGHRIPHRNARLLALRDAMLGRWGEMSVAAKKLCGSISQRTSVR
jgi:hypothetical protein